MEPSAASALCRLASLPFLWRVSPSWFAVNSIASWPPSNAAGPQRRSPHDAPGVSLYSGGVLTTGWRGLHYRSNPAAVVPQRRLISLLCGSTRRFPGSAHRTIQRRLLQPQHQKSLPLPAARLNRAVLTACIPPVAQRLRDFDSSAPIALDHSEK